MHKSLVGLWRVYAGTGYTKIDGQRQHYMDNVTTFVSNTLKGSICSIRRGSIFPVRQWAGEIVRLLLTECACARTITTGRRDDVHSTVANYEV